MPFLLQSYVFKTPVGKKTFHLSKLTYYQLGKAIALDCLQIFKGAIIIIGVLKVDSLIDLKDALYLHLLKDKNIPFRFWDYSLCKDYDSFFNSSQIPCKNSNPIDMCK